MTTSSNQKRAMVRNKCRRALAEQINKQLGLEISPEKIRLQPRHDDPYRWSVAKPVKYLFKSNLSSGSVGYFQKICDALESGDLIEAVAPQTLHQEDPCQEASVANETQDLVHGNSFTATIQKLEQEKQEAISDSQKLRKEQEQELLNAQREWETKRDNLQKELLLWKHAAQSHELRFQGMKEKIFPALDTLKMQLLEFFDTRDVEQ
ncbi:hypothetical protein BDV26DRAFT_286706 [Aspergillus bertholletiae]|uniref:Uncharacterized protein n=1 Tax=Aspergillus bertholletiae TaxID=1226010 RepID=A0A5N7ARA1_9EURO|nr:hypothetical protein BDV26DRAFT_286706 [Aspergillus bertholletiae]